VKLWMLWGRGLHGEWTSLCGGLDTSLALLLDRQRSPARVAEVAYSTGRGVLLEGRENY
jgi:hypothetical protein